MAKLRERLMAKLHCYHVDNRYGIVWTPRKRVYNVYVVWADDHVLHVAVGVRTRRWPPTGEVK